MSAPNGVYKHMLQNLYNEKRQLEARLRVYRETLRGYIDFDGDTSITHQFTDTVPDFVHPYETILTRDAVQNLLRDIKEINNEIEIVKKKMPVEGQSRRDSRHMKKGPNVSVSSLTRVGKRSTFIPGKTRDKGKELDSEDSLTATWGKNSTSGKSEGIKTPSTSTTTTSRLYDKYKSSEASFIWDTNPGQKDSKARNLNNSQGKTNDINESKGFYCGRKTRSPLGKDNNAKPKPKINLSSSNIDVKINVDKMPDFKFNGSNYKTSSCGFSTRTPYSTFTNGNERPFSTFSASNDHFGTGTKQKNRSYNDDDFSDFSCEFDCNNSYAFANRHILGPNRVIAVIDFVLPGSPADKAGLQMGDGIISFGTLDNDTFNNDVVSLAKLAWNMLYKKVPVKINRDEKIITLTVVPEIYVNRLVGIRIVAPNAFRQKKI